VDIRGIKHALAVAGALCIASQAHAQQIIPGPEPLIRGGAAAVPSGDPSDWISAKDYPAAALAERASGIVVFRLRIDPDGMASDCTVIKSSGSKILDSTTCKLVSRRARFLPARDANNEPAGAMWGSAVRWDAPAAPAAPPTAPLQ
jgi:periplasmic protein TonB